MAEKLGEALLDLDTNDKGLKAGINRSERLAVGLGKVFDDTSKRALALGRNMAAGAAIGAAALTLLVKRSIDYADAISKGAASAGMTTEELSRLAWAAELADVSLGSLTASTGRLSNLMAQMASGGAKDTKAIFDALGISVTDAEGKLRSTADVIPELADVFAGMENGAEKTALAIQIFGRSGAELIPLLNEAAAGLAEAGGEADRFGLTVGAQAGRDAEEFNDTLTRMGGIAQGLGLKIGTAALPNLRELMATISSPGFASAMQSFGSTVVGIATAIAQVFVAAHQAFGDFMDYINQYNPESVVAVAPPGGNKAIFPEEYGAAEADIRRQMEWSWRNGTPMGGNADPYAGLEVGEDGTFVLDKPAAPPALGDFSDFDFSGLGGGGAAAQTDQVNELIASLRGELDVLNEMDPVQQRMISLRQQLTEATPEQRAEVEALIQAIEEEGRALEMVEETGQFLGDTLMDAFDAVESGSKSAEEVVGDLIKTLAKAALQGALLGQGPLGGLFGGTPAGGGMGGLLGSLFSGFHAKGGLIPNGSFGIVGEAGPEPVIGTSRGARVLPNSALAGMGGGGGLEVNVNNYAGVAVDVQEEDDGRGGRRLNLVLGEAAASEIARPNSRANIAARTAGRVTRRS